MNLTILSTIEKVKTGKIMNETIRDIEQQFMDA
jgi:hypothetical protein